MKTPFSFLFAFILLLRPTSSTTIAIIHSFPPTVCAIPAGKNPLSILCATENNRFPLLPSVSFQSISGGGNFLCGLTSPGTAFFCWNPTGNTTAPQPRRVYSGPAVTQLAVGEGHIAAAKQGGGKVLFWRRRSTFPPEVDGNFTSLTSGNGFTCGVHLGTSEVRCFGNSDVANMVQTGFLNKTMSTIEAGDSMVCGLTADGMLICGGKRGALEPFHGSPFELSSPAVGRSHLCAIVRANETVVCWRGQDFVKRYNPVDPNTAFTSIVAGGNLTCGLLTVNLTVLCWTLDGIPFYPNLPRVLPGRCVEENDCSCGIFEDSGDHCSDTGVICKPCIPPPPPAEQPPPPNQSSSAGKKSIKNRLFLAFGIVGSVLGVCSIVHCIWAVLCRHKQIHNSVQPTIVNTNHHESPPRAPPTSFSSSIKSFKSHSANAIFSRQGSRLFRRQRSGPSSAKFHERAEEFTFKELSFATGNFSPATRIGTGSFGSVYRGKLPNGNVVAIKRSEPGARPARQLEKEGEFHSELAFLSRLHHKHLVALLGFCEEGEERLLVYEYMANGSLYDHLHPKDPDFAPSTLLHSSWRFRIKVLLDAARGIEYLHSYAVPPIIHRDIKSSNILIDANWAARISDFGLSEETEGRSGSMKTAGTVGYMDPEYYGLQQLTTKSDVYSFGVVMLEMLTGKRAIFKGGGGLQNVVDYALGRVVEGDVGRVLDERVNRGDRFGRESEGVELVAFTAVRCVSLEGKERPSMREVVANLEAALAMCDEGSAASREDDDESQE